MKKYWKYTDNKSFIVESRDYENGIFYFAWVNPDDSISSLEHLPANSPHTTVCCFEDMQDFVDRVDWLSHVRRGIRDDLLQDMVDEKISKKKGRNDG